MQAFKTAGHNLSRGDGRRHYSAGDIRRTSIARAKSLCVKPTIKGSRRNTSDQRAWLIQCLWFTIPFTDESTRAPVIVDEEPFGA